jgi:hypothetical protein
MSAFEALSHDPLPSDEPWAVEQASTSVGTLHPVSLKDGLPRVSAYYEQLLKLIGDGASLHKNHHEAYIIASVAATLGDTIHGMLIVSSRMEDSELLSLKGDSALLVLEALQIVCPHKLDRCSF